jgi:hypothetical protein
MMAFPSAPYNAKPAPIHTGDFDAVGFSNVFLTSSGYASLVGGSGQQGAAAKPQAPIYSGGLGSQVAALVVIGAVFWYLEHRIAT